MQKKILVSQLQLGMHLLRLDGSWLNHPFWKSRFVIEDPSDLDNLWACGIEWCWIDTELGKDLVAAAVLSEAPPEAPPVAPAELSAEPAVPPEAPRVNPPAATRPSPLGERSMAAEIKQAAAICNRGREAVTAMFKEARMGHAVDAQQCLPLVEEISGSVLRNPDALVSLARLKSRDDYSYMHSVAVCALMISLARKCGMADDACREAGLAGLLHDIGKALMPLEVLNKPGKLSDDEFELIRTHPVRGHELLSGGHGASEAALDVALHHHERMDGTGYPFRKPGDQLSVLARMGAICDVYDAITSNRPYKAGWDPAQSMARMASWKGHFDPQLFAHFVQSLGIYPTGSVVKLASGNLAVVVEQNASHLVVPVVMVFFSGKSHKRVPPQKLDLARPGTQDRIVGREEGAKARFPGLDALWADPETLSRVKE